MRCLSLKQQWVSEGGRSLFVSCMVTPNVKSRLASEDTEIIYLPSILGSNNDAQQTASLAKKFSASWVILDGYAFDSAYQKIIKDAGLNLLLIDDNGSMGHYYADIVLNQNIHANKELYQDKEPYVRLLLGTKYVLLRAEFLNWHGLKREIPKTARNILVTLGGSDPENVTLKVIKGIQETGIDNLNVISGC